MAAPRKNPPPNAAADIERLAAQGHAQIGIAKHFKVSRDTLKRWLEEYEVLQEAFEIGRETERQALHALVVQSAAANKPANVNAFFILKARHGYRDNDSPNTKVDVSVMNQQPVMIVKDFGSDEAWSARLAEQQRLLTLAGAAQQCISASQNASQEPTEPVGDAQPVSAQAMPSAPSYAPPWKGRG